MAASCDTEKADMARCGDDRALRREARAASTSAMVSLLNTVLLLGILALLLVNRQAPYPACEAQTPAAVTDSEDNRVVPVAGSGAAETLSPFQPEHANDIQWLGLRYIYITGRDNFVGKYFVEGVEALPEDDIVLIHTALQDKSFVWYGDKKQLIELQPLVMEHARRLRANSSSSDAVPETMGAPGEATATHHGRRLQQHYYYGYNDYDDHYSGGYSSYDTGYSSYSGSGYGSWSGYDYRQAREDYEQAEALYGAFSGAATNGRTTLGGAWGVLYETVQCYCSTNNFCTRLRDITGAQRCA